MSIVEVLRDASLGQKGVGTLMDKANEVLRQIDLKCPPGFLKQAESARVAFAIEIACRQLKRNPSPLNLVSKSALSAKMYREQLHRVENIIGVRELSEVTIEELGVAFGGMDDVVPQAEVLIKDLKNYLETASDIRRHHISLRDPAFNAAAFFTCVKQSKNIRVSRDALLKRYNLNESAFSNAMDLLERTLSRGNQDHPSSTRFQHRGKLMHRSKSTHKGPSVMPASVKADSLRGGLPPNTNEITAGTAFSENASTKAATSAGPPQSFPSPLFAGEYLAWRTRQSSPN